MAKIAVVGAGYVGLTTGACFAHLGHEVVVADVIQDKVERLNRGEIPIYEDGLERIVKESLKAGRLRFVLGAAEACRDAEFHYLCVPTPETEDGSADLSYVIAAAEEIAAALPADSIVVNKSTVPVGTTTIVERVLDRPDIKVVSNPEFLREGTAVSDFMNPDRVVVGSSDQDAAIRVSGLYAKVTAPVVITDPVSSELIKYASNAFLATKLTFVNEIATLCENIGADIEEVMLGMGFDSRIGRSFLKPGPGWGGSCFPKDTAAMVRIAADAGVDLDFLSNVLEMNDRQFTRTADKVRDLAGGDLNGRKIAVWGLTFKAGTDDLRSSPSIEVLERLLAEGAEVTAYDPTVDSPIAELPGVKIVTDPVEATAGADVLAVLTEWPEFRDVDPALVAEQMMHARVVDARNLLDSSMLERAGFTLVGIGR